MDIDALLQEHGENPPSGEDLEYDPEFTEMEIAATPGDERQVGNEFVPGDDPDYKEVSRLALSVIARSHDLRAGIFLAEAQLRLNGLSGFADGTTYIRRCLEEYWPTCHPQLDAEDDDDPTMRVNAVLALADDDRILRGLRKAPLTASRTFGMISLRHIAVADGEITPPADMENVPDVSAVAAAFQDTDEETLRKTAEAAAQAMADVTAIGGIFDMQTPGQGPDLDPVLKLLKKINMHLRNAIGEPVGADVDAVDESTGDAAPEMRAAGGGSVAGGGGAINSPVDVENALDRIIGYYERKEPSSPLPILLRRAKKLVNADFLTIMRDMAPSGMENVNVIGGLEDDED
ncbi:type VI secretion system protein TssA [Pseudosulfitobacter koreensis]|uniref:Type VI secretion system protein TssA n=1 Tax=Pseudosulfitobacter koreensis TaxID=2968472 RepID=A0ABT1Z2I8_9RHOB|nr:type VI secretion system protein TssA [Pseudosulfitobacter koreense]MCR8827347.1 type VI secretion system protein TssA [Pseudosulfitobacter koreense]